jgi:hypothetical protein
MDAGTLAFFSYAANLVAQGADSFLTSAGLAKGFTELNPLSNFMIKKLGQAGWNAIKMGALPFLGLAIPLFLNKPEYANAFNFTMAAVTAPVVVWNFIQLKRKKIAIFG